MNLKKLFAVIWSICVFLAFLFIPESTSGTGLIPRAIYALFFFGLPLAPLLGLAIAYLADTLPAFIRWLKK